MRPRHPLLLLVLGLHALTCGSVSSAVLELEPELSSVSLGYRRQLRSYRNLFVNCALKILKNAGTLPSPTVKLSDWHFVSQVYVTHYTRSPQRLRPILDYLLGYRVVPALITHFDREDLTRRELLCFNPAHPEHKAPDCPNVKLEAGYLSLTIKHYQIFYDILHKGHSISLIIEDDNVPCPAYANNVTQLLHATVRALPPAWDIVLLTTGEYGDYNKCESKPFSATFIDEKVNRRATSAYLVSPMGAMKMIQGLPLRCPIDYQMDIAPGLKLMTVSTPFFAQNRQGLPGSGIRGSFDVESRPGIHEDINFIDAEGR